MAKLALIIKSRTQPDRRADVYRLYREHMAPRAEENDSQEVVVWCDDAADSDAFYLFEIYRDQETFTANAQAPWFADYMAAAGPLLAAEPEVVMAAPAWATGIDV